MPSIKQYRQQTQVAGPTGIKVPTDVGSRAGAASRRLGGAISQAGRALATQGKRQEQSEVSSVNAALSTAQAELSVELQKRLQKATPGDETFSDKFQEDVRKRLESIGQDVSTTKGRAYFEATSAKMEGQFLKSSFQGQAHLAGLKAKEDYSTTINKLSSSLIGDPSSLPMAADMHNSSVDALVATGQLPRNMAVKLRAKGETALAKASIRGWIKLDPNFAKEKLTAGEFDTEIAGDLKAQLFGEADQALRARDADAARYEREQLKIKKLEQQKTQNEFLGKMQEGSLRSNDILNSNLDAFGSGSKDQFLRLMKQNSKDPRKLKTNPATMIDLYTRIHLDDGDPNKLVDENDLNQYFGKGLGMQDLNSLRAEMQGKKTQAGSIENDLKKRVVDIAKGTLSKSNPLTGMRDPKGDEQLQKFMIFFLQEYQEQRQKGKTASELLDPGSRDYLGKYVDNYRKTPQQVMRESAQLMRPVKKIPLPNSTPKINPGEDPLDFLKRINKKETK